MVLFRNLIVLYNIVVGWVGIRIEGWIIRKGIYIDFLFFFIYY